MTSIETVSHFWNSRVGPRNAPFTPKVLQARISSGERLLIDVDCWSMVRGQPFGPGEIADAVRERLGVAVAGERGVA